MFTVFERPLASGQVYPCTTQEIAAQLARLPSADLDGLQAIGLVPSTHRDCNANDRYFAAPKPYIQPYIHLYSYPGTLCYRLLPHTKRHEIERGLAVEIAYGMETERQGSRWICRWTPERLRAYTLEHVLLHEIGHHVFEQHRRRTGFAADPSTHVKEQFAEDYALRHHCPW